MTSPAYEIQVLLVSTLKANAAVMALVDGVYDTVPANPFGAKKAYISLGPEDFVPDDAECLAGELHTVQIDVWSRSVGMPECKKICSAVRDALHEVDLQLADNAFCECRLTLSQTMRDPDGITIHGAMQFEIAIEIPE